MKYFFKNSFRYVRKYIPVQVFALLLGLARILILLATPQIVSLLVDRVVNPLLGEPPAQTASIFEFLIAGIPADDYVKIFGCFLPRYCCLRSCFSCVFMQSGIWRIIFR